MTADFIKSSRYIGQNDYARYEIARFHDGDIPLDYYEVARFNFFFVRRFVQNRFFRDVHGQLAVEDMAAD